MKEIWKDVEGYEGIYRISNIGNLFSLKFSSGRLLKPQIDNHGYYIVRLSKNGKIKTKRIHKLVAIAFLNHVPNGHKLVVNHINFNREDNRVSNLEIITQRENASQKHLKSSSKYTGVHWLKANKKWMSYIIIDGKKKHLGLFNCELEASSAYEQELKKLL